MILIDKEKLTPDGITDSVSAIENECFSVPWTKRSIKSQILTEGSVFSLVCTDDGTPAGYICGQCVADECELYRIAVLPAYRRLGAADMLMAEFIAVCQGKGVRSIFLEVRRDNEPAKRLYEKHGFTAVGLRKNYYTEPICDALIFRWPAAADFVGRRVAADSSAFK